MKIKYENAYKPGRWNPFRRRPHFTELPDRRILTNIPDLELCNNQISTAKYHIASFLIFNLIEQFSKPANLYFFIIGLLQLASPISISDGKPTMYVPLLIVITISMIKDFVEDLKRHKSDREENNRYVEVLSQAGFVRRRAKDIRVGDIVKVKKNEFFPCDLLLLRHSDESGFVYVETKNLDGETNLKQRKKHPELLFLQTMPEAGLIEQSVEIFYEKPNPYLYTFNGNVKQNNTRLILDNSNILLRGCSLKISQFAMGVALYTGHDTKVMLNSTSAKPKRSGLEDRMNTYFKITFVSQFVVTFLCGLLFAIFDVENEQLTYAGARQSFILNMLFSWGTWFIIFASFVPISLLVTLELIRFFQGVIINKDKRCQVKATGEPTSVQSSNLNDELGQVNFVLSDKTGTLTKNVMNFRFAHTGGMSYGEEHTLTAEQIAKGPTVTNVEFADKRLFEHLKNAHHPNQKNLQRYLALLSMCHVIIPERNEYNASSPDELALANFAKFCSYVFIQTSEDGFMVVDIQGKLERFKLLHVLEFNSDRKRMSVILRDNDGDILLLCKGADSIIESRLIVSDHHEQAFSALQRYASMGLRTLMLAQKRVPNNVYEQWNERYSKALAVMSEHRHEQIEEIQSQIEKELVLVGITAIEDKLQDNVAETILLLRRANIGVWMLTGDKKETAISIGHSAGLIDLDTEKIVLDCPVQNVEALLTNVESIIEVISPNRVLIVSGSTLTSLPQHLVNRIFALAMSCKSVVCCRVSPKQKEDLVELVKREGRVLAIGDGANDVNMINKSHVGVGIKGLEGGQAARAADYVIGEFQILRELLFNYGRENYRRNSTTILFNIYKNMVVIMPVVWYGSVSMFSGSYIYDNWLFQFYNTLFTTLPIILYSLTDQEFDRDYAVSHPQTYRSGQVNQYFNKQVLLVSLGVCVYQSIMLLALVFGTMGPQLVTSGHVMFESSTGMIALTVIIFVCNIRPALFSYGLHAILLVSCFLGILAYYLIYVIIQYLLYTDIKNTLVWQLSTVQYWVLILLGVLATEGVYVLASRYIEFDKNVRKEGSLLAKEQAMEMADIRQHIPKQHEKMTSEILEPGHKVYTGYAFDEDENRENL